MEYVDVDGDPSTSNSSQAVLPLADTSTVLWAGLYWGAFSGSSTRDQVDFAAPGRPYGVVTADQVDLSGTGTDTRYHAYADVTDAVVAAGPGTYGVADIRAATGQDRYAGWSLVVAYADATRPPRNLTVFDGFASVTSTSPSPKRLTPASSPPVPPVGSHPGRRTSTPSDRARRWRTTSRWAPARGARSASPPSPAPTSWLISTAGTSPDGGEDVSAREERSAQEGPAGGSWRAETRAEPQPGAAAER